jgi:hypothetical protein
MARAYSLITDRRRLIGHYASVLVIGCIGLLPLSHALEEHTLVRTEIAAEHTRAIAGYISQEKRFLMYLFNGNVGKAQIA